MLVASAVPASAIGAKDGEPWHGAPRAVVQKVTHVPEVVFDAVGLQHAVTPPVVLRGQRQLTFDGKPGVFYEGSEPCPYSAAERWAFVVATSRFGTWSQLGTDASSPTDVYPSTQTFTFSRARYASPYIAVRTVEHNANHPLPDGDYPILQQPSPEEATLYDSYTSAKYFPANPGGLPFVDFGNRVVISSSSYDPGVLHGQSQEQIAGELRDPTNPVTHDIVATANYLTAAICLIDGARPVAVCQSQGVIQSAHFDRIDYGNEGGACAPTKTIASVCTDKSAPTEG